MYLARVAPDNGHTYIGNKCDVIVKFKFGEDHFFPSVERLKILYAYRQGAVMDENTKGKLAPGPAPSNRGTPVDINAFPAARVLAHEGALRKTTKQFSVTLEGNLHERKGCSMAKVMRTPIPSKTYGRAAKRLSRVFVDLVEKKHVASMGGNTYPMTVRDDFPQIRGGRCFRKTLSGSKSRRHSIRSYGHQTGWLRSSSKGKYGKLCREGTSSQNSHSP